MDHFLKKCLQSLLIQWQKSTIETGINTAKMISKPSIPFTANLHASNDFREPNMLFFWYGSLWIEINRYPVWSMTERKLASSISASVKITVSFFRNDDETFFTGNAWRTASLMWFSHIPHIIPSILAVIFVIVNHPFKPSKRLSSASVSET